MGSGLSATAGGEQEKSQALPNSETRHYRRLHLCFDLTAESGTRGNQFVVLSLYDVTSADDVKNRSARSFAGCQKPSDGIDKPNDYKW